MGYNTSLSCGVEITPKLTPEDLIVIPAIMQEETPQECGRYECPYEIYTEDDTHSLIDCNFERPYEYDTWIKYLAEKVFEPRGYKLNGCIDWQGEDYDDRGTIWIKDNKVEIVEDVISNPGPSWGFE